MLQTTTRESTVFVVDDDLGALESLCWLIEQADLHVRPFRAGAEFLDSYQPGEPGCVVLDLRMPGVGGLDVQEQMRRRGIYLPIIFITAYGDVPSCTQAFKSGAFHFLEKPVDDRVLIDYVRRALAYDAEQKRLGSGSEFAARMERLTPAEKEVLDLLISGKTLKDIAAARNVTVQTAWRHRAGIFAKMDVENDVELVRATMQALQWTYSRP